MRLKHQPRLSPHALSNSADATSTVSFGQATAGSNGVADRSIRQIHSPSSIGGSTRSRNSALRWKDRASSPVPAVANSPYRQRACAAPCRSPTQTSFCEQTSHRSVYLAVRLRTPLPSLTLGICVISAGIAFLHASLSSAFLSLRQVVISSALGMNALQSLSASGVHAKRCSGVPCEKEGVDKTVADSKASDTHHRTEDVSRSIIRLFWFSTFIRGPAIRNRSRYSTSWQIQIHSCRSPCL